MPRHIIIAICLFVALALGAGLLWPNYQDLKILQKKIEEKGIELQYKEEYFSELKKTSEALKEYSQKLLKIDAALPASPDLPSLFDFLQKASSQSGLVLNEIKIVSTNSFNKDLNVQETSLFLSLSGSYSALKDFLLNLQNSARLIEVESISFLSPEKGETFFFNLKIKIYSY
ncbi:type 4a pilus biogenesis protein PilO [Patescibacteria group bacterium]